MDALKVRPLVEEEAGLVDVDAVLTLTLVAVLTGFTTGADEVEASWVVVEVASVVAVLASVKLSTDDEGVSLVCRHWE
jgi:hypothetical protein